MVKKITSSFYLLIGITIFFIYTSQLYLLILFYYLFEQYIYNSST